MQKYNVVDLCCGMGGLSYAAKTIGLNVAAGFDISEYALNSYKTNFPDSLSILCDISNLIDFRKKFKNNIEKENKDNIIFLSGPPCQGFSDAGPRQSNDPRNNILLSVAKIIAKYKPVAAIVENVNALKKKRNIPIVNNFYSILWKSRYHIYCLELNSLDFGVPQKRNRLIYFILPNPVTEELILNKLKVFHRKAFTVKDCIGDLPVPPIRPIKYDTYRDNESISNHYSMRHSYNVRKKINQIVIGKGPLSYRKLDPNSYAPTLLSGHRAPPAHYNQPRSITVREALRLQGFPDSFRVMGAFSSQMGQVTNAVPLQIGIAIINVLLRFLSEKKNESRRK